MKLTFSVIFSFINRYLSKLIKGNKHDRRFEWSEAEQRQINHLLVQFNRELPSEIHRAIRSFEYIKRWKGTEFRTFILYVGIVVLKDFVSAELYDHFLQLHCAVSICHSNTYKKYLLIAKQLFDEYIEKHIDIFGIDEIVSNIHNLSHVVDDVNRFGNLNEFSAYEFENTLGKMKNSLKRCDKPLEQISRRITESFLIDKQHWLENENTFHPSVKYMFQIPTDPNVNRYRQIMFKPNVVLSSRKFGDKFFLTHDNEMVELDHVIRHNNSFRIFGFSLKNKGDFYSQPCSSRYLNTFVSDLERENGKCYQLKSIKCKLICLSYKTDHVLMLLQHSLD